ncbi:MAG: hypothetical protein ACR2QE_09260 [Acidimicrobiales bacterium]
MGVDTIKAAEADIAGVQSALGVVQEGLGMAESVAEASEAARHGLHTLVKVGIVLLIVSAIVGAVMKKRSAD